MGVQYNPGIVTEGLVLSVDAADKTSYPGSGTTWTDLSGNGNDGTFAGDPTFNSNYGGIIDFDGSGDYITISDSSDWNIGTSDFAIEMWINSDANGSFALFNHYESSNVDLRIIHHDALGLLFYVNNTTYPTNGQSAVTLTANVWHHIVFTRVASTLKYYLDKLVVATQASFTTNIQDYSGTLEIGRVEQSTVFDGEIAITRFYVGRGLSEKEVLQNFNAQRGRFGV